MLHNYILKVEMFICKKFQEAKKITRPRGSESCWWTSSSYDYKSIKQFLGRDSGEVDMNGSCSESFRNSFAGECFGEKVALISHTPISDSPTTILKLTLRNSLYPKTRLACNSLACHCRSVLGEWMSSFLRKFQLVR